MTRGRPAIIGNGVSLKGTRSTDGEWTLAGLTVGKPLFVLATTGHPDFKGYSRCFIKAISGTNDAIYGYYGYMIGIGSGSYASTNVFVVVPIATTVVLSLYNTDNSIILNAYQ